MLKYVYFKNRIVLETQARIPLATHTIQYGTGVFDSVRGYQNKERKCLYLLKPDEHFARLLQSAKILGWNLKEQPAKLTQTLIKLVKKNKPQTDIYVRPFIFQASTALTPKISADLEPTIAMYMISLGDYIDTTRGLKGIVSSWNRMDDNMAPPRAKVCGIYINSALARSEAERQGADEAIFLNKDGHVAEGSAENIFIVRDGQLITPPVSANILEGVARAGVMEIAKRQGIIVVERQIDRTELYIADEVFLTGTGCQIAYFSKVDGRQVGSGRLGPITKILQSIYFDAVRGLLPEYHDWLVKV